MRHLLTGRQVHHVGAGALADGHHVALWAEIERGELAAGADDPQRLELVGRADFHGPVGLEPADFTIRAAPDHPRDVFREAGQLLQLAGVGDGDAIRRVRGQPPRLLVPIELCRREDRVQRFFEERALGEGAGFHRIVQGGDLRGGGVFFVEGAVRAVLDELSPMRLDAIVEPFEVAPAGKCELLFLGFGQMTEAIDGGQPFRQQVVEPRRCGQARGPVAQHELIELVDKNVGRRVENHACLRRIVPRKKLAARRRQAREGQSKSERTQGRPDRQWCA